MVVLWEQMWCPGVSHSGQVPAIPVISLQAQQGILLFNNVPQPLAGRVKCLHFEKQRDGYTFFHSIFSQMSQERPAPGNQNSA